MLRETLASTLALSLALAGCGGSIDSAPDDAGTDAEADVDASAPSDAADASETPPPPDGPVADSAPECGASTGGTCASDEICMFPYGGCGFSGVPGWCAPAASLCTAPFGFEVCGCDGRRYASECAAALAGTDVSSDPSTCADAGAPGCSPALVAKLAAALDATACTTLVRLDEGHGLLGYAVFCGADAAVDEATARKNAFDATGYGTQCGSSVLVDPAAPPPPLDAIVIVEPDRSNADCVCCDGGWVAAVSASTALPVFTAKLAYVSGPASSTGVFPASFLPATDLDVGCHDPSATGAIAARGWDLRGAGAPGVAGAADVGELVRIVAGSALAPAIEQAGHRIVNALVLELPGASPGSVESVVLVQSHALAMGGP